MKRHGRSHVLERELAVGGQIMRARLTRGEGFTRADRDLDNSHESRRTTLPVLLTRGRIGRNPAGLRRRK